MTRIAAADGGEGGCGGRSERALHLTKRASAASTCLLLTSASASASCASSALAQRFKAKDERKRLLKLSVRKLKDIDDPETLLCRSVLINNTVRRLQSEIREEKAARRSGYSSGRSYSPSPYSYFNIERVYRQEVERVNAAASAANACARQPCYSGCTCTSAAMEAVASTSTGSPSSSSSSSDGEEEDMAEAQSHAGQREAFKDDNINEDDEEDEEEEDIQSASALMKKKASSTDKKSKSVLDEEECELLLGEVCMPPRMTPPQMIAGLDDEDDMAMAKAAAPRSSSREGGGVLWTDDLDSSPAWDEAVEETADKQSAEPEPAAASDLSCATTPTSEVMEDDEELWNEISSSRWEWSVGDWTSSASASSAAADSAMPSVSQWSPSVLNDAHVLDSQQHHLQQTYSYVPHPASSHQQHSMASYEPTSHFTGESDPCGPAPANMFSCGQTSMLSEMQPGAVFGSGLLASLET